MVSREMTSQSAGFFGWKVVGAAFLVATFSLGVGVPLLLFGCILFGLGVSSLVALPLIIQKEFPVDDVGRAVTLTVAINQPSLPLRRLQSAYCATSRAIAQFPSRYSRHTARRLTDRDRLSRRVTELLPQ
jgi:hypothetical protein